MTLEYQVSEDGSVVTRRQARELLSPTIPENTEEVKMVKADPAGTLMQRHAYYEKHREEILADIEGMGGFKARQKWGIPTGSWYNIRRRWHGPIRKRQIRQLPPWNEQWPNEVKLAWLNTYGQVFGK